MLATTTCLTALVRAMPPAQSKRKIFEDGDDLGALESLS